jgi:hypothetical protein
LAAHDGQRVAHAVTIVKNAVRAADLHLGDRCRIESVFGLDVLDRLNDRLMGDVGRERLVPVPKTR